MYGNELKHYGVPGMKWGVRKDRTSGSTSDADIKQLVSMYKDGVGNYFETVSKLRDINAIKKETDRLRQPNDEYQKAHAGVLSAAEKVYRESMGDDSFSITERAKQRNVDPEDVVLNLLLDNKHYSESYSKSESIAKAIDEEDRASSNLNKEIEKSLNNLLGKHLKQELTIDWSSDGSMTGDDFQDATVSAICKNLGYHLYHSDEDDVMNEDEDSTMNENELKHWGILGMKWGVRKSKAQLAKDADKKKAENADEKFLTSKKKSISKMSDDEIDKELSRRRRELEYKKQKDLELKQQVDRLELEAKFASLNPPKVSLGKKLFDGVWPTIKAATLKAGGTLLEEGLTKKGKELLGLNDSGPDYKILNQQLDFYSKYKNTYSEDHPDVAKIKNKKKDND